jgi:Flp pilus assembly protein TadD
LLTQKKFADVVELLEPLAQSSPNEADVFALLGQAYAGVGRRQDARRAESQAQALRRLKK